MSRGACPKKCYGKTADEEKGAAGGKNPERNNDYSESGSQDSRAPAAPFVRQMANHCSAADCANTVNDPCRGLLRHAIVALFTEKSLIHVLGPMRHRVERRHQQNDVQQQPPVPF